MINQFFLARSFDPCLGACHSDCQLGNVPNFSGLAFKEVIRNQASSEDHANFSGKKYHLPFVAAILYWSVWPITLWFAFEDKSDIRKSLRWHNCKNEFDFWCIICILVMHNYYFPAMSVNRHREQTGYGSVGRRVALDNRVPGSNPNMNKYSNSFVNSILYQRPTEKHSTTKPSMTTRLGNFGSKRLPH